jgi:glycosyltransferase involved in cell wall biosynthesis
MKTLVALTKYGERGASSRVRFVSLFSYLESLGWRIVWYPMLTNDILDRFYQTGKHPFGAIASAYCKRIRKIIALEEPSVWWIEKELYYGIPEFLESSLARNIIPKSVIDYDDGVYLNYAAEKDFLLGRYQKFAQYAKSAAVITYGSEGIGRQLRSWGARKMLKIPSTVNVHAYALHSFAPSAKFIVGWIGTPVTKFLLDQLKTVLQALAARVDFELHVVGGAWACEGVTVRNIAWTPETEAREVSRFDVGIMPLRDTEWEKCKCGYKLIQYMSAGVVPVGAAIGENKEIVRHGATGYLCTTESDWLYTLELLARDRSLCARIGQAARLEAERRFDNKIAAGLVAAALLMAGGDAPHEV